MYGSCMHLSLLEILWSNKKEKKKKQENSLKLLIKTGE